MAQATNNNANAVATANVNHSTNDGISLHCKCMVQALLFETGSVALVQAQAFQTKIADALAQATSSASQTGTGSSTANTSSYATATATATASVRFHCYCSECCWLASWTGADDVVCLCRRLQQFWLPFRGLQALDNGQAFCKRASRRIMPPAFAGGHGPIAVACKAYILNQSVHIREGKEYV